MKIIRVTKESERAGAYYVRIQAMMRKYQIPLDAEVDSHDGADCNYILALDDIYPVATCRWFHVGSATDGVAEIGRVVVLPEYRGQHLGQAVVAEAERWMREEGFKNMYKHKLSAYHGVPGFRCAHCSTAFRNPLRGPLHAGLT